MKKFLIAAAALVMASCGNNAPVQNLPLENTTWKLVELGGDANEAFAEGDSFTFTLDGESITGKGSVNRFFGGYELTDDGLDIGTMGMTRMMGPNVDLEDAFVRMFDEVDGFSIAGNTLLLTDDGETIAVFEAFTPEENVEAAAPAGELGTPVMSVEDALKLQQQQTEE